MRYLDPLFNDEARFGRKGFDVEEFVPDVDCALMSGLKWAEVKWNGQGPPPGCKEFKNQKLEAELVRGQYFDPDSPT
jgi:hypothetical protein